MIRKHATFNCPLCDEVVGPWSRGITYHALMHNMTQAEYWLLVHNQSRPTCSCDESCQELTSWNSWENGYNAFAKGHYDSKIRAKNTKKQLKEFHWARGKTKHTSKIIAESAKKCSKTLQNRKIIHWSKTNNRQDTIRKILINRKSPIKQQHWKWSDEIDLMTRISKSSGDVFDVKTINNNVLTSDYLKSRRNNKQVVLRATCRRCNHTRELSVYSVVRGSLKCRTCDNTYMSQFENEVGEFLSNFTSITKHYGPWGEIDHFSKKHMFGVECNGLYWHSDAIQTNTHYHETKRLKCNNHGISLFHLFEDEWRSKNDIICSMLKHRFGKSISIGARTLKVVSLQASHRREFFETCHVDGDVPASFCYALVDDNKIFAAASFRNAFHLRSKTLELARYCSTLNHVVIGGLSKLIKHLDLRGQDLISYQDTRFGGTGNQYFHAGFEQVRTCSPRFWWTDTTNRFGRLTIKAKDGVSEADHALMKRRYKIWGTSNILWKLKYDY